MSAPLSAIGAVIVGQFEKGIAVQCVRKAHLKHCRAVLGQDQR